MALSGYPKTFDHPKQTILVEGEEVTGRIAYIKAMGDDTTDWVEYEVKIPNSDNSSLVRTIRTVVGGSLFGPFSYVKHNDEGETGAGGTAQNCYTQIIETEI